MKDPISFYRLQLDVVPLQTIKHESAWNKINQKPRISTSKGVQQNECWKQDKKVEKIENIDKKGSSKWDHVKGGVEGRRVKRAP